MFISVILNETKKEFILNTSLISYIEPDDLGVITIYDNDGNGMCVVHSMTDMKLKLGMCNIV